MGIVSGILAKIVKKKVNPNFQAAGDKFKDEIEWEMRDNIMSIVYGAGTPTEYDRTYQYYDAWEAEVSHGDGTWRVDQQYHPRGSHPSWWQDADVTNGLDEIIIDQGACPIIPSFAAEPRDHWTPTAMKARELAVECIKECM